MEIEGNVYVCMRIYSGRRGYGLPLLDYAWLIQLINKRNASPQNTVQSTSLNLEHTRDHITKNATTAHS